MLNILKSKGTEINVQFEDELSLMTVDILSVDTKTCENAEVC